MTCFIDLAATDTIVIRVENEASANDIKVHAVNLNAIRIGD